MKGVWKKLAILSVALAATLYVQDSLSHITLEDEAWETACDITQECTGVAMPIVVRSDVLFRSSPFLMGAVGLYAGGEPYVYVRASLDAGETYVVMVHEMVHYLNAVRGYHQDVPCDNEASAFKASDEAALRIGRLDLVRGADWHITYRGCGAES